MNGEYVVINILLNDDAVSDIVGNRIYLDEAPQNTQYPLIIIEQEDSETFPTKSGRAYHDRDFIRVFPYADNLRELKDMANAIRDALDFAQAGLYRGIRMDSLRFQSQNSFSERIANRKTYAKDQLYEVWTTREVITADSTLITADSTLITADNF